MTDRAIVWLLNRRVAGADGKPLAWGDETGVSTTLTCSAVFALTSSLAAGLNIADGMDRAKAWTDLAWKAANPAWATLERTQTSSFPAHWSFTGQVKGEDNAAAALALIFLGRRSGDVALESLLNRIKETAPPPAEIMRDPRLLYLATLAGFQRGGDWWAWWDKTYRAGVPVAQRAGGCFEGSWDPPVGMTRGRLQSTALILLSLDVYYCYRKP